MKSDETTDNDAAVDLLGILRACTQHLRTAATCCDSVPPTATRFAEKELPLEVWDMPRHALREAWIAAGKLTIFCLLKERLITDTEVATEDLELLATIRANAKRLVVAWQFCDEQPFTITDFIDTIMSGYSEYQMPLEQLREASLAAGILVASAAAVRRSIADLLDEVSVKNQLAYRPDAS